MSVEYTVSFDPERILMDALSERRRSGSSSAASSAGVRCEVTTSASTPSRGWLRRRERDRVTTVVRMCMLMHAQEGIVWPVS
mmetsp:Transcript_27969/g.63286  ORF Transcript_27969/g.63286 Transcript_27969/m.63286 type:complete len:82 (+) Transcript_27969:195-440(+)